MSSSAVKVLMDRKGRYRTAIYDAGGKRCFCIAEKTARGVLISEFYEGCEVRNQACVGAADAEAELRAYLEGRLGKTELYLSEVESCGAVEASGKCSACGNGALGRELGYIDPVLITEVPVVPIFRCRSCGKRHYSLGREYLRRLVEENQGLFSSEEIAEFRKDEEQFINTLQEYIIRLFASKKIERMERVGD